MERDLLIREERTFSPIVLVCFMWQIFIKLIVEKGSIGHRATLMKIGSFFNPRSYFSTLKVCKAMYCKITYFLIEDQLKNNWYSYLTSILVYNLLRVSRPSNQRWLILQVGSLTSLSLDRLGGYNALLHHSPLTHLRQTLRRS